MNLNLLHIANNCKHDKCAGFRANYRTNIKNSNLAAAANCKNESCDCVNPLAYDIVASLEHQYKYVLFPFLCV